MRIIIIITIPLKLATTRKCQVTALNPKVVAAKFQ